MCVPAPAPPSQQEHLVQDLCRCAGHVEAGAIERAGRCLARATGLAAAVGDGPLRRLAVPMADALARRLIRLMVPAVADALIDPSDHLDPRCLRAARRSFFELSPFPRAAVAVANRAIIEAMENEKVLPWLVYCASPPIEEQSYSYTKDN